MPLNSVNTNVGAMIALQNLNAINAELAQVQTRISTGLKVSSVKDDPSTWAIAQKMRADSRSMDSVMNSLQRGRSVTEVAISAGETISDLLIQMKEKMLAASDTSLTARDRAALNEDYVSLRRQIDRVAGSATFNGVSLVSSGSSGQVRALANIRGDSSIDVDHIDLTTGGAALSGLVADLTATVDAADLDALDTAMEAVSTAVSRFGTGAKALETHLDFVQKLQDTTDASIGRLVDADMAKEAARLQALQVRQQLAVMALGIANSAPNILLQLFRR